MKVTGCGRDMAAEVARCNANAAASKNLTAAERDRGVIVESGVTSPGSTPWLRVLLNNGTFLLFERPAGHLKINLRPGEGVDLCASNWATCWERTSHG